jgi:cell division protein FtsZ
MIRAQLEGVDFLVANTDAQSLNQSLVEEACRIQLGPNITKGLGAGSKPDVGQGAAEESASDILPRIKESNMVFITAGMGGGTGTGAAPVIARIARDAGILTVGVVTKPFYFEGAKRAMSAERGVIELKRHVDTLIIIPNQNLFRVANEQTTFSDAFKMADEVLYSGVRGVTDLMIMPGLINLDFADVKAVMAEMGNAMMGTGESDCERRAVDAAEAAIANPLLDDVSLKGAKGVLISITGGKDMTLFEVDEATNRIREDVDNDANIIFGATFDERLEGRIRVSVVATGIGLGAEEERLAEPEPVAPKDEPLLGVGNMLRKSFGAHAFSAHNNLYAAPPSELEEAPAHENCAFVSEEYSQEEPPRRYVEEIVPSQRNGVPQNAASGQNGGRYPYQNNVPQQTRRPSLLERLTRSSRRANYEGAQRPDAVDQDSVDIPAFLLRDKNTKQ